MADRSEPRSVHSVSRLLTTSTMGVTLLALSGLGFTGACLFLIMATPPLILFSPILVPAGIVTSLIISGFLFSGGSGMAAMATLLWVYNSVSGKHPPGADKLNNAMERIANKFREVNYKTQMHGQHGQFSKIYRY